MILFSLLLLASAPETTSDLATVSAPAAMQRSDTTAPASPAVNQKGAAPTGQSTDKAVSQTRAPGHKRGLKAILGVLGTILGSSLLL